MKDVKPSQIVTAINELEATIVLAQEQAVNLSVLLSAFAKQNGVKIHDSACARRFMGLLHNHLGDSLDDAVLAHQEIEHLGKRLDIVMPRGPGGK